jgi:glycosyl transferase, family 25
MFESVEKVVYINLDERKDRRAEIQRELLQAFPATKIQRFPAIRHEKGAIGCTKSHIAVLEMAKAASWANVLIVEDDLAWQNYDAGAQRFDAMLQSPYDVIVLGGSYVRCNPETGRLQSCQTTTGYIVAAHYYDTLLANFKEGLCKFEAGGLYSACALDQYWKRLQPKDNWFIVQPLFCMQRPGFSDIEKRTVDYTRFFK